MISQKRRNQIKWGIYAFLLLLLYVLQTTPGCFAIRGVKPVLLISLAVVVSCFETPLASGIYGLFCGLFIDVAGGRLLGFNALILLFCCVMISLVHINFFKTKLPDTLLVAVIVLLIQQGLTYFFYYSIWALDPNFYLLLHQLLPSAGLSLAWCIPLHYLVRWVEKKLQEDDTDLLPQD